MGGTKAPSVKKSLELWLASGKSHEGWYDALVKNLVLWRSGKVRVKFVDYALTFEEKQA